MITHRPELIDAATWAARVDLGADLGSAALGSEVS
jgi:hypothetical protein